jgi:DNA-binding NtrC family response regulator
MRAPIERAVTALITNPFAIPERERRDAVETLSALDAHRELRALIAAREIDNAKLLLLAVGHVQACATPDAPSQVLPKEMLPSWSKLPRDRGAYLRVVMAAGRCYRALGAIRGTSDAMNRVRGDTWSACFGDSLRHVLDLEPVIRDHDVLLLGETGTGKEAVARAILAGTPGDDKGAPAPTSAINAAAVPDTLVESALFGHVKGAFTGAQETRIGHLRSANGGSLFLDEVGDLPSTTQIKLLRVIETNEVYALGSDEPHRAELRYVAATHKNLEQMVDDGAFRRDLYQRLAGHVIRIPPLRERPDDMVEIGIEFVRSYLGDRDHDSLVARIETWLHSDEARDYAWPGNVRELQNALRSLMLGLGAGVERPPSPPIDPSLPPQFRGCEATMEAVSDWYLRRVLAHCDDNYTRAAKILEVDRSTVRRRVSALRKAGR